MKKTLSRIAALSLALGFLATAVYASETNSRGWDKSYRANELIGLWVMNHEEKYFGKIQDLVFDPDGHMVFAIVGHSRFNWRLIGENSVAIPFNALVYRDDGKHPAMVADISFEKFKSAPKFAKNDSLDRQRVTEIYRYFGQQPYWTEGHKTR